jgi:hypothetical protein
MTAARLLLTLVLTLATLIPALPTEAAAPVGAWNLTCKQSHQGSDDPIVFPGKPGASHNHTFFGNTTTNANTTEASLLASGDSTCNRGFSTADHSAYWVPTVYKKTGSNLTPVMPTAKEGVDVTVYYRRGGDGSSQKVTPFPQGFRMIAGDPHGTTAADAVHTGWFCRDDKTKDNGPHFVAFPDCGAGRYLLGTIVFPNCWDGKNLDSADHKSHVTYATGGKCPAGHPVKVPQITYDLHYHPAQGPGYVLSTEGRYTLHGDFFAAWDNKVQQALVTNCDNAPKRCVGQKLPDIVPASIIPPSRGGGQGQVLGAATTPKPTSSPAPTPNPGSGITRTTLPATGPATMLGGLVGLSAVLYSYYAYRTRRRSLLAALRHRP